MGIQNGDGYGDRCENHKREDAPYCYVDRDICIAEDIEVLESGSTFIDTTFVGYSEELCRTGNQKKDSFFEWRISQFKKMISKYSRECTMRIWDNR